MKQSSLKYSLFIILSALFALSACSQDTVNRTEKKEYTFETAKDKGAIIDSNGKIYNIEKLDHFIEKYNTNKGGSVRITRFNEKNEPLIMDLTVKKEIDSPSIYYDVDYTKTREKESEGLQYSNNTCQRIIKEVENEATTYKLECPDIVELIKVPK